LNPVKTPEGMFVVSAIADITGSCAIITQASAAAFSRLVEVPVKTFAFSRSEKCRPAWNTSDGKDIFAGFASKADTQFGGVSVHGYEALSEAFSRAETLNRRGGAFAAIAILEGIKTHFQTLSDFGR